MHEVSTVRRATAVHAVQRAMAVAVRRGSD